MKPDAKIYQVTEERVGLAPEQLIFADDKLENIEAAKSRGWNVIHHQLPETTIAAVRAFIGG